MPIDDSVARRGDPPIAVVAAIAAVCRTFPDVVEEPAWIGVRWRVCSKTFAHVAEVEAAWPPVYVRAMDGLAPATVLTFESSGRELVALRSAGPPFFAPSWRGGVVGLVLDQDADWDEIAELLTESYCAQAPARLAALVDRPPSG